MLVLSRQRDQSIIIGKYIVVTVVDIRGDKVRLGIDAPTEIPVHRREVYEAIQRENLRAIGGKSDQILKEFVDSRYYNLDSLLPNPCFPNDRLSKYRVLNYVVLKWQNKHQKENL